VVKRLLDIFSLRTRRNGYLGASSQNLTPPFALATSISYKTGIFPLSNDVYSIYLMFFAQFHFTL